jgi:electron transfer flavoprotein beta subunit
VKIIVPVKQAATLDEDFALVDGKDVGKGSLEWDVNEWDTFTLEAALQIKEAAGGGEIVVVSVGGDEVGDGLLTCLAMGADRAIHVETGEDDELDALGVAQAIAAAVRDEAPDLVLCGVQSSDGVTGATGVALAAALGLPRVAVVRQIELADGTATVHRELEGGLVEVLKIRTPALLTVQTGINEPRYANLRGIRKAKEKPRTTVALADLERPPAASRRVGLAAPASTDGAEMLDGSPASIAEQIAAIIKRKVAA